MTASADQVAQWRNFFREGGPEVRLHAAEQLAEQGNHASVTDLEQMALHDTGEVQVEGEMSTYSVQTYHAAFRALEAIYRREGVLPEDVARMTQLLYGEPYSGGEHEARLIRLLTLGGDAIRPALRQALRSPASRVVIRALNALETLGEPDLGVDLLSHPDPSVRCAAARLWPARSVAWLEASVARLAVEPESSVRECLAQAAAGTPVWWHGRFYRRRFSSEVERWMRLHQVGLEALLNCRNDPEPTVRLAAAKWLAQFTDLTGQKAMPGAAAKAVEWVEAETDPAIRTELLRNIPYDRWKRALARSRRRQVAGPAEGE